MTGLPNGWTRAAIADLATLIRGVTYKKEQSFGVPGPGRLPILRANNIDNEISFDDLVYVEEGLVSGEQKVRMGDIVLAMSSGSKRMVGKSALVTHNFDGSFGAFCGLLRLHQEISSRFISYLLTSRPFRHHVERLALGTNINNLKRDHVLDYEVALPPFTEQRLIVAKIEELFSELDKGVEALATARQQLDAYRLVVLHQAVNDKGRSPYSVKPLDDLIGPIGQGWSPKCDVNTPAQDGEWAIIKTTAVQPMSYLPHECKPLPPDLKPRLGIEIRDGDLLMTRKGPRSRTGVACHVKKARPHSMLCDTVYRFRAVEGIVLPEYLEIALNAPSIVQEINARKSGISESGISLNHGKLRSLPIPVPGDLASQERVVQTVREQLSLVEHIGALIEEQAQRVDGLRQSILQRTFSGQLVAQDPNNEPASVLLERIRAERENETPKKRCTNKNKKEEA